MRGFRQFRLFILAFFALTLTVVLANCAGSQPAPREETAPAAVETAPEPSTLVYGSGGQPVSLDPGAIEDGNSLIVQHQIYNQLIEFAPGTTELEPGLATNWSVSDDSLTWTFKLREGVTFHDGSDFNAEAVKINVERWWDPESKLGFRDAGKTYAIWEYLFSGFKDNPNSLLQSVNVIDNSTIEFVLNQPFAAFPAAIAAAYFGIASPKAIQAAGADYGSPSSTAVGTGAFIFKEWRSGDRILLEKNPNYWREGLPKEDQLVISFVEDPAARLAQLRAKTLDFTVELTPDQLSEIETDSNLEPVFRPSFNVGYLALNPSYEPLSNPKVRFAIAQAINKEAIVETFWRGLGKTDGHFTPPSLSEFQSKDIEDYAFDPDTARKLLSEAGYPDGFDLELWYMPVSRPYFPNPKPIAEAFAAELNDIGVNVTLKTQDWGAYLEGRNTPPGFQAFMLGWTGDYGDPDNFFYAHFGPGATADLGDWQNEQVFKLLDQARAEGDQDKRAKLYAEVDDILFKEALRIPIVHSQPLLAQRINVEGWTPSPFGSEPFDQVEKK